VVAPVGGREIARCIKLNEVEVGEKGGQFGGAGTTGTVDADEEGVGVGQAEQAGQT